MTVSRRGQPTYWPGVYARTCLVGADLCVGPGVHPQARRVRADRCVLPRADTQVRPYNDEPTTVSRRGQPTYRPGVHARACLVGADLCVGPVCTRRLVLYGPTCVGLSIPL